MYAAIAIVFLILKDWGFAWMIEMRSLWIAVVLMGGLGYLAASSFEMSAGSDWYREHDNYVKIYELTTVEVTKRVGSWGLKLVDKNGRSVEPGLTAAQLNPKLWDLVYNGILHSVCDGAEVNYRAVKMLQLERIGQ
ncbi:hypothetical protein EV193_101166 [Herbihabitans rhizosphaerae]|uniref:Uncharacterized protein n=1 Tax=Herbihabitans rhizosphaerae TaxID=1872711 RepID=A0A4Q7L6R1_9PSEU|nr:hypothetical protein EV193_101166 [Herbihabitans rhizosphaerae]